MEKVYEYFLNDGRLIRGWAEWPAYKRQDLAINQAPHPGMKMIPPRLDSNMAILSDDGKNFRLEADGSISEVDHVDTERDILGRMSVDQKIKLIVKGIDNPQDADFRDFVNKLNALPEVVPAGKGK